MRLIDADALMERMKRTNRYFNVKFDIEEAPTIEAEPVRHGRWVDNRCTECGEMPMGTEMWESLGFAPPRFERFMDFCPCCGTKMDGGGDK